MDRDLTRALACGCSLITTHDESLYSRWHVSHAGAATLFVSDHVVGSSDAHGERPPNQPHAS